MAKRKSRRLPEDSQLWEHLAKIRDKQDAACKQRWVRRKLPLNQHVYGAARRSVRDTIVPLRNRLLLQDTKFWVTVATAADPATVVDYLYSAVQSLCVQVTLDDIWLYDANVAVCVVHTFLRGDVAALFMPLLIRLESMVRLVQRSTL